MPIGLNVSSMHRKFSVAALIRTVFVLTLATTAVIGTSSFKPSATRLDSAAQTLHSAAAAEENASRDSA